MPRKLPPLKAIRTFEVAARHASFTHAASELHVTHGAVSQQIKSLEDYFQQPLFIRSKGKVSLNSAGEKLLPVISDVLDRIERISEQLRDDTDTQTLTIHLTAAFAGQWLIPRLSDFQQHHPNIIIRLSPAPTFAGFQDLVTDVAIRWGTLNFPAVTMEKLFDVNTFMACSASLLQTEFALKTPADLKHHTLIHDDNGESWQALLKEAGIDDLDTSKSLHYSDSSLALKAAIDGQGVIAAGSILAAQDLAAGRLIIPFNYFVHQRNAYYLYYPERCKNRKIVQVFRQWIHQQASIYLANSKPLEIYRKK